MNSGVVYEIVELNEEEQAELDKVIEEVEKEDEKAFDPERLRNIKKRKPLT